MNNDGINGTNVLDEPAMTFEEAMASGMGNRRYEHPPRPCRGCLHAEFLPAYWKDWRCNHPDPDLNASSASLAVRYCKGDRRVER